MREIDNRLISDSIDLPVLAPHREDVLQRFARAHRKALDADGD